LAEIVKRFGGKLDLNGDVVRAGEIRESAGRNDDRCAEIVSENVDSSHNSGGHPSGLRLANCKEVAP
jgi:hypothetical protein